MNELEALAAARSKVILLPYVDNIVGEWLVGSRAFNVHTPESDYDFVITYIPTKPYLFGLHELVNYHGDYGNGQVAAYPVQTLVRLIEARNPNVDFIPNILNSYHRVNNEFWWLMHPEKFDNPERALKSYYGYARGQYEESFKFPNQAGDKRKQEFNQYGYIPKALAHAIRILRMGKEYIETGTMQVYRTDDAAELRQIRAGLWPVERVRAEYERLLETFPKSVERPHTKPNNEERLIDTISEYL